MPKAVVAFEGMARWIIFGIIILIFVAIFLLFGKQIVDFIIKNLPWKALIKCDPSIANC
jgi:hypothetical protein